MNSKYTSNVDALHLHLHQIQKKSEWTCMLDASRLQTTTLFGLGPMSHVPCAMRHEIRPTG